MVVTAAGRLLPAPFAEWLTERIAIAGGKRALADEFDWHARRIDVYVKGAATPTEDGLPTVAIVDRILTRAGDSIARLYGSLYDLPITEPDRRTAAVCSACGERLRTYAELCGFCLEEDGHVLRQPAA